MAERSREKSVGGVPTKIDWGRTIPNTNYAIGLTEFFFYSLLAAAGVGAIISSNIFELHAGTHATINPMSEWRNPWVVFQNTLAEDPFAAGMIRNTVVGVGGLLLVWMLLRSVYTSGAWASDKIRRR